MAAWLEHAASQLQAVEQVFLAVIEAMNIFFNACVFYIIDKINQGFEL